MTQEDLTGRKFGPLLVVEYAFRRKGNDFWQCLCDCGKELTRRGDNLVTGHTRACPGVPGFHIYQKTPEYYTYMGMQQRCTNRSHPDYANYGGRGIECRYRSFKEFLHDVGPRPGPDMSIDRVDNDGHYEPGNCRWATRKEQQRNKRNNRYITYQGETKAAVVWEEELGLASRIIRSRWHRGVRGEALFRPARFKRLRLTEKQAEEVFVKRLAGVATAIIAADYGVSCKTVRRITSGETFPKIDRDAIRARERKQ